MMNEEPSLLVPILDALNSLPLEMEAVVKCPYQLLFSSAIQEEVRSYALHKLSSARLEDLPILIRFLLQSSAKNTTLLNLVS